MRNNIYLNIRQHALSTIILQYKLENVDFSLISFQEHAVSFNKHEEGLITHTVNIKKLDDYPSTTYQVIINESVNNGQLFVDNLSRGQ